MNINTTADQPTTDLPTSVTMSRPAALAVSALHPSALHPSARHQAARVSLAASVNARRGMSTSWLKNTDSLIVDANAAAFAGKHNYTKQGSPPRGVPR